MKQTIYTGGVLRTMTGREPPEAMLVREGRIYALGNRAELQAQAGDAQLVELRARTLLPSFVDAHSHLSQCAAVLTQCSLAGADSAEEIRRRVSGFVSETRPAAEAFVLCSGYDPRELSGGGQISIPGLEQSLGQNRALVIQHCSGHVGWFGPRAMEKLGLSSPEGGEEGLLEENAYFSAIRSLPAAPPQQMLSAYARAQKMYASYGITTIQEGLFVKDMLPLYKLLMNENALMLDTVVYPDPDSYQALADALPGCGKQYWRRMRIGGIKVILDGSPQAHTAWMRTPYAGTEERGSGSMTDGELLDALEMAARLGLQVLAHCNGDAAAEQFLSCVGKTEKRHPDFASLRPVMIHAQLLGLDQLPRVKALGIVPSFFVAHVARWGDAHIESFGLSRASQISPAGSALEMGIPFTFHQDAPVLPPDMLATVQSAACRTTPKGVLLGKEQRIGIERALAAVTSLPAWQYFEEGTKGVLAAGAKANLVLLSGDPMQTPPEEIGSIRVLQTIREGETLYSA